jgi:hypothetical protein
MALRTRSVCPMNPTPNPISPNGDSDDEPKLDEKTHPSEPHPDEPRAASPADAVAGEGPPEGQLSDVGEPHPDEPRVERSRSEPEPPSGGAEPAAGTPEDADETSDAPEHEGGG